MSSRLHIDTCLWHRPDLAMCRPLTILKLQTTNTTHTTVKAIYAYDRIAFEILKTKIQSVVIVVLARWVKTPNTNKTRVHVISTLCHENITTKGQPNRPTLSNQNNCCRSGVGMRHW